MPPTRAKFRYKFERANSKDENAAVLNMPEKKEFEKLKAANTNLRHEIAELKRSNKLLAAEKKILDEILDNLPGTFYIWDDRPQIIRGRNGDVRAESALQISSFMKFNTYAKISQIRCPRDFASCHGPGYRTKKDIHKRYGPQRFH